MINYGFYIDACIAAQGHNNKRFYINELYAVRSVIPWETMLLWHVEGMRVWVTAELVSACDSVCDRKWGIIVTIPQILSIQDIYTSLTFTHTLSRHCYTHTHTNKHYSPASHTGAVWRGCYNILYHITNSESKRHTKHIQIRNNRKKHRLGGISVSSRGEEGKWRERSVAFTTCTVLKLY